MGYKVSFKSGTGHDDIDEDTSSDDPIIISFNTEAERKAFIRGVNWTVEVTNGWLNAWVEVKNA